MILCLSIQGLGELEQRWRNEVEDIRSGQLHINDVFFVDYHLLENKVKDLACLCFLRDVELDLVNLEDMVNNLRYDFDGFIAFT